MEGVQLGPDLRLIRRLGYGGMGKVWLAHHLGLSRQVALKVLHRSVHAERHHRERFEREAKAVGRLHHPGFIEALDFGDLVDGRKFLAMEYVEGRTLEDALREQGYLPWRTAARIGAEVAGALAFAHAQGVVHRDLKPDNVMIEGGDPETGRVRILDLGLAELEDDEKERGWSMGTPSYSAPEQLRGEATDARADVYGLGAVLFRLIAGHPAHAAEALDTVKKGCAPPSLPRDRRRPRELDLVVASMLAADPGDRPPGMEPVQACLRRLAESSAPRRRAPVATLAWVALGIVASGLAVAWALSSP